MAPCWFTEKAVVDTYEDNLEACFCLQNRQTSQNEQQRAKAS